MQIRNWHAVLLAALLGAGMVGCDQDSGPVEATEEAAEETGEAAEDTGEEIKEESQQMKEDVEDTME